jgi:hypothetical protein
MGASCPFSMMLSAKASTFCKSRVCRRFTGTQTSWIARVCFQHHPDCSCVVSCPTEAYVRQLGLPRSKLCQYEFVPVPEEREDDTKCCPSDMSMLLMVFEKAKPIVPGFVLIGADFYGLRTPGMISLRRLVVPVDLHRRGHSADPLILLVSHL